MTQIALTDGSTVAAGDIVQIYFDTGNHLHTGFVQLTFADGSIHYAAIPENENCAATAERIRMAVRDSHKSIIEDVINR